MRKEDIWTMRGISNKVFGKQVLMVLIMTILMSTIFIFSNLQVFAARDVNEVSGGRSSTSQSQHDKGYDTKSDVDGLKEAFDTARVDNDDLASASKFASPFVKAVKYVIAVITAIFTVLLGLVTMLDLLYLAVPPIRGILCSEQPQAAGGMGGGMGGMGMGGMGMGRMGMGGGMGGAPQPSQTGIGRFVSDEAVAALAEATQQAQGAAGGMGMGMGGMGMGGMGMGGMGMGAQQAKPKTKSVILTYLKKRAFAVVMFVVCLVLFTSTLFTDLGLYIGQWIIDIFNGLF